MVEKSNRIAWLDGLKFFAILLVVWGHVLPRMGFYGGEAMFTGFHGFIYSFHMPLFMTLSGFVSYKIVNGIFDVKKKFLQLIVPCITLSIICFVVSLDENFWYLKSLFLCYLVSGLFFKIQLRCKTLLGIITCIVVFPVLWHIPYLGYCKLDFMLPFFGYGLLIRHYYDLIKGHSLYLLFISLASLTIFALCELFWSNEYIWYNSQPSWLSLSNLISDHVLTINWTNMFQVSYRYITGLAGALFFITLFIFIYSKNESNWLLKKCKSWGGILCISILSKRL